MTDESEIRSYDPGAMAGRPPMSEAPIFGKKLAALRKSRGITQAELADMLGVRQQTVTHYERRTDNPSLELINRLAMFFDVTPAELVDKNLVPKPKHKSGKRSVLDEAVERARKLSSQKQKVVAQLIDAYVRAES